MTVAEERDGEGGRKSETGADRPDMMPAKTKKKKPAEVGQALRTVYQRTVEEDIPPEMLDLLGKLG